MNAPSLLKGVSILSQMDLATGDPVIKSTCKSQKFLKGFDTRFIERIFQCSLHSIFIEDGWMAIGTFLISSESMSRSRTSHALILKPSLAIRPIVRAISVEAIDCSATELTYEIELFAQFISGPRMHFSNQNIAEFFVLPSMKKARLHTPTLKNPAPTTQLDMVPTLRKYWIAKYGKAYSIDDGIPCRLVNVTRFVDSQSCPPVLTYPSTFLCTSELTISHDRLNSILAMKALSGKILDELKQSLLLNGTQFVQVYRTSLANPSIVILQKASTCGVLESFNHNNSGKLQDLFKMAEPAVKTDTANLKIDACKAKQSASSRAIASFIGSATDCLSQPVSMPLTKMKISRCRSKGGLTNVKGKKSRTTGTSKKSAKQS